MTASELYIGLISGTSLDAIDAALVSFSKDMPVVLHTHAHPIPLALRRRLLSEVPIGVQELARIDAQFGECFADAAQAVLSETGHSPNDVRAIGSHGQTIDHQPASEFPSTLQIGDPNRIVERTKITTIADFRRRDIAAGGQGAPLAPAFHAAVFRSNSVDRVVVNIGGIANITVLSASPDQPVCGYDSGPGNGLMDHWSQFQRERAYDENGAWSASGSIIERLLQQMQKDPYFALPPPKSTGREYFHLDWIQQHLAMFAGDACAPEDVQATLAELTVWSIADAIQQSAAGTDEVLICGGGVHNQHVLNRLRHHLPDTKIDSTAALGIDPDWVEAVAFAWLAKQTLDGKPGNLPSVTGASRPVVLGGIYPAGDG